MGLWRKFRKPAEGFPECAMSRGMLDALEWRPDVDLGGRPHNEPNKENN
jgi:hypothetical protein